jgi:hypothetical protein
VARPIRADAGQRAATRPTPYGHREVLIRGYVDEVAISCGAEVDYFRVTTR